MEDNEPIDFLFDKRKKVCIDMSKVKNKEELRKLMDKKFKEAGINDK